MSRYVALSCTDNNLYSFFLPIVTWSWKRLGFEAIVFIPKTYSDQFALAMYHCPRGTRFYSLDIPPEREITYFQCARLYAAALPDIDAEDIIITSDIDMAVFGDYFEQFCDGRLHVAGHDIAPLNQYPICYVGAPSKLWQKAFRIQLDDTVYSMLDKLLGDIHCDNMRGNYWAKDQETAYNCISESAIGPVLHARSQAHHPTASNRADRDGWEGYKTGMIDAHLPRPGHVLENYNKIKSLLIAAYPEYDFTWMHEYREQYCNLTNG